MTATKKKKDTSPVVPGLRQLGVKIRPETLDLLNRLRVYFAVQAGLVLPITQADAIEKCVRDAAQHAGLEEWEKRRSS